MDSIKNEKTEDISKEEKVITEKELIENFCGESIDKNLVGANVVSGDGEFLFKISDIKSF